MEIRANAGRSPTDPNDLTDLDALAERELAFQDRHTPPLPPFDWTFIRADLDRLLERIAAYETTPATTLVA